MSNVRLLEWERLGPTSQELCGVELSADASALGEQLTANGSLTVEEKKSGLWLQARSYVGRVRLGELVVTIQPKIAGTDLLRLFEYAYGLGDLRAVGSDTSFGSDADLFVDVLVRRLLAEVQVLVERGLHRTYVRVADELGSPRGTIDMRRLVAMTASGSANVPCVHHPRDEDHVLNQVLRAGLRVAAAVATDDALRMSVRRAAALLDSVSDVPLSATTMVRARRALDRRVARYAVALDLIEILWSGTALDLGDNADRIQLPGFLFDMNRLWQSLLGRLLRENLEEDVIEDRTVRGALRYMAGAGHPTFRVPTTRPDFVVRHAGKTVAVLDAKYRDLWENKLPESMLYQLAVYAAIQGTGGTATILYPTQTDGARDVRIEVCAPGASTSVQAVVLVRPILVARLLAEITGPAASRRIWVQQLAGCAGQLCSALRAAP